MALVDATIVNSVKSDAIASSSEAGWTSILIVKGTVIFAEFEFSGSFAGLPIVSEPYPAGV